MSEKKISDVQVGEYISYISRFYSIVFEKVVRLTKSRMYTKTKVFMRKNGREYGVSGFRRATATVPTEEQVREYEDNCRRDRLKCHIERMIDSVSLEKLEAVFRIFTETGDDDAKQEASE